MQLFACAKNNMLMDQSPKKKKKYFEIRCLSRTIKIGFFHKGTEK